MTKTSSAQMMNEQIISTQETEVESVVDNNHVNDYEQSFSEEALNDMSENEEVSSIQSEQFSNGLENFGVEEETPDLFNSDNESLETQNLLSSESNEDNSEDDDLEIPAFLRRQKN